MRALQLLVDFIAWVAVFLVLNGVVIIMYNFIFYSSRDVNWTGLFVIAAVISLGFAGLGISPFELKKEDSQRR